MRASAAAALLYTPYSVLFARGVRGDVLLSAPRPQRNAGVRKPYAAAVSGRRRVVPGEDLAPLTGVPEEEDIVAGEERLGRRVRRFLEHYVGSEARARA